MGSTRRRVALAEDDPDQRELILELLQDEGFDVIAAADGAALLSLLRRGQFDLVITDLWMPSLNGGDVVHARRRDGDRTPVIVITAATQPFTAQVADVDRVIVLQKPFTRDWLLAQVGRALSPD